jgi:hypothetical protein
MCACGFLTATPHQSKQSHNNDSNTTMTLLDSLLQNRPDWFGKFVQHPDDYRIKIVYTQIDRDENNSPHFTVHKYNTSESQYFYPASTVKFPVSILALEKLRELNKAGVDKNTVMIKDTSAITLARYTHPSAANSAPSVANYIKQILLVSDNDAYNQLYEFVGQESINRKLWEKGYNSAEIRHRLEVSLTPEQNRLTGPVFFLDNSGQLLYRQEQELSKIVFSERKDLLGGGYINGQGEYINEPFDFSLKNKIELEDLNDILKAVIFPDHVPVKNRFSLTKDDYDFLYWYMSAWPRESIFPTYSDTGYYYDAYCKFLLLGSQKSTPPPGIRIFNKVGDAYGFLTDVAYIVDFTNKVEFMLSATIYCNSDGVFNDNNYDYDDIGYPFMQHLGQVLYDFELKRKRRFKPDLSRFEYKYDSVLPN